ncbi:bromodomain-containing protein 7 [Protopterus annectens]|uniref:bromodomain-containing protein 7 n=1 Tax=Protopterus annectens TaxID=7888 RepID=UPI001CFAAFFF|nr:bromodomain-containing protein 7 [Protopterus annectens]
MTAAAFLSWESAMGKKHKKHKSDKHQFEANAPYFICQESSSKKYLDREVKEEMHNMTLNQTLSAVAKKELIIGEPKDKHHQKPKKNSKSAGDVMTPKSQEKIYVKEMKSMEVANSQKVLLGRPPSASVSQDWQQPNDYMDKPLKLVLKMGGSEVAELSTGTAGIDSAFYEEKLDHDKHKEKKKKKKKKGEKEKHIVPEEKEKKKKKVEKKKKVRENAGNLILKEEQCHTPQRVDTPTEKPLGSPLVKPEEKEQTPLQEALSQLTRQLQRKDPSAFFAFPVTDFIAPGYSQIIKHPMDFSTIKRKIKDFEYQTIEELKEDFKLMCENAMTYNKPDTIYYKAARKLFRSGMKILSQERIQSLKQSIEFMADLEQPGRQKEMEDVKPSGDVLKILSSTLEPMDIQSVKSPKIASKEIKRKEKDASEDKNDIKLLEKELEYINYIIYASGGKLSKREIDSHFQFERRKPDGTTTLGFVHPSEPFARGQPLHKNGHTPSKIGALSGKLQSGVNTLQGFKEDKRNKVTPVTYLNYGPFSSYAPTYDSSGANISKEDSDLIYSTYGEDVSKEGSLSIQEYLNNADNYISTMADNFLDVLTNGQHSRMLREMGLTAQEGRELIEGYDRIRNPEIMKKRLPERFDSASHCSERFTTLKTVTGFTAQQEVFQSREAEVFQRKLDETTQLLRQLQDTQNERLSSKPPPNTVCLLAPSAKEMQLADRVTRNLKDLARKVAPGNICSVAGVRKAMGISQPLTTVDASIMDFADDFYNPTINSIETSTPISL